MTSKISDWDIYFMSVARQVSRKSPCLSRQIGSVLVKDKSIISTGYNGPARGIPHCETRNESEVMICPRRLAGFKSGEGLHLCPAVHSEENCIINAARNSIQTNGTILYCDCGVPCKNCLSAIINAGIVEIIYNGINTTGNLDEIFYDELSKFIAKNSGAIIRSINF